MQQGGEGLNSRQECNMEGGAELQAGMQQGGGAEVATGRGRGSNTTCNTGPIITQKG